MTTDREHSLDARTFRFPRSHGGKLSALVHKDHANDALAAMQEAWESSHEAQRRVIESERIRNRDLASERKRMVQDINDMHASPHAAFRRCVCGRLHSQGLMCPTEGCDMGDGNDD